MYHRVHLPIALLLILSAGCDRKTPPTAIQAKPAIIGAVTLEFPIDGATDVVLIENVADGDTLESVLREMEEPVISIRGSGSTAFVDKIGNVETTGGEGWTFSIDGEWPKQGVGSVQLHPPTTVRWKFGTWEP